MPDYTALAAKASTHTSVATATGGAATATIAPPSDSSASHYITGITGSYSAAPAAAGTLTIKEDSAGANTTKFQAELPAAAQSPYSENWGIRPLKIAAGKNVVVNLTTGAGSVVGTVSVRYFTA